MATADQVKALVRCHVAADDDRFYAIVIQVAAHAAKQGHVKLAKELRGLVDAAKLESEKAVVAPRLRPVPIVQPRGELSELLTVAYPRTRIADLALDDAVGEKLERILLEQRQQGRLREHGLAPLRKVLLVGPPGTGKTMTAAMLATELGLPLFTIRFDGLISKFMGETASKLRLVFDAIAQSRAIYFFDEFDALGGERSAKNDVGEIRRVLNAFLQLLEQDESDSLIVAATNHPALLDRALFRRFDMVLEYGVPSRLIQERIMRDRLAMLDATGLDWEGIAKAAEGLSHADVARACDDAVKRAILADRREAVTEDVVGGLLERRASRWTGT